MSPRVWLLVIFGIVNHEFQLRAEDMKTTCAAHDKWTVFQRRKYGNVSFDRGWEDYKKGFGDCDGDFWLGLEQLHQLTKGGNMSLEINMLTRETPGIHLWAKYRHFRVGPESDNYRLSVFKTANSVGDDLLSYSYDQQFSTKDADHEGVSANCAFTREGGWWYYNCFTGNLNGNSNKTGAGWVDAWGFQWFGDDVISNLCCSEMKIYNRP